MKKYLKLMLPLVAPMTISSCQNQAQRNMQPTKEPEPPVQVVVVLDRSKSATQTTESVTVEDFTRLEHLLQQKGAFELSVLTVESRVRESITHTYHKPLDVPKKNPWENVNSRSELILENQGITSRNEASRSAFFSKLTDRLNEPLANYSLVPETLENAILILEEYPDHKKLLIASCDFISTSDKEIPDIPQDIEVYIATGQDYNNRYVQAIIQSNNAKRFLSFKRIVKYLENKLSSSNHTTS